MDTEIKNYFEGDFFLRELLDAGINRRLSGPLITASYNKFRFWFVPRRNWPWNYVDACVDAPASPLFHVNDYKGCVGIGKVTTLRGIFSW